MSRIRVLIADDHPVFRYGLRALLMAEGTTMEVVGEATSGEEAVTKPFQCLHGRYSKTILVVPPMFIWGMGLSIKHIIEHGAV